MIPSTSMFSQGFSCWYQLFSQTFCWCLITFFSARVWVKNANYVPLNLPLLRSTLYVDPFCHCHAGLSLCRSVPSDSLRYRLSRFYLTANSPLWIKSILFIWKVYVDRDIVEWHCQYALQIHRTLLCQIDTIWHRCHQRWLPWLSLRYTYSVLCRPRCCLSVSGGAGSCGSRESLCHYGQLRTSSEKRSIGFSLLLSLLTVVYSYFGHLPSHFNIEEASLKFSVVSSYCDDQFPAYDFTSVSKLVPVSRINNSIHVW